MEHQLALKTPRETAVDAQQTWPTVADDAQASGSVHRPAQPASPVSSDGAGGQRRAPVNPATVLKHHRNTLSVYEQAEILSYPQVLYYGARAKRKVQGVSNTKPNRGYDDERGDYIVQLRDHIAYRYEIMEILGKGSFGQVLRCYDYQTERYVAMKLIRNKRRFHLQAQIEVSVLEFLRQRDADRSHCIVQMIDHFTFRDHLCITFELLGRNLYELIKMNNFAGFSIDLTRHFAVQILRCLKLLQENGIIHCDMKPENILLASPVDATIKVIDFGSSCFSNRCLYTYIQSRFYRSPEVILGQPYGIAIDMWSLGCVLAELYTGYPLFPGENEVQQLACIMEILGVPSDAYLQRSSRRDTFFDALGAPKLQPDSSGRLRMPSTRLLSQALRYPDNAFFVDFVSRCLAWDPFRRMTPADALEHPWIAGGGAQIAPVLPDSVRATLDAQSAPSVLSPDDARPSSCESTQV